MNALFALGLVGPLLLLVVGFIIMGLLFSGAALMSRCRSGFTNTGKKGEWTMNWAIRALAGAAVAPILAGVISHFGAQGTALGLTVLSFVALWPASIVLTFLADGAGRGLLLFGHGLIALWVIVIISLICIHGV